jgi:hypothetical protein
MAKKSKLTEVPKIDRSWEISDAMRTLQRAEEIKKDKFLMGGIKKSLNTIGSVIGKPSTSKKKK